MLRKLSKDFIFKLNKKKWKEHHNLYTKFVFKVSNDAGKIFTSSDKENVSFFFIFSLCAWPFKNGVKIILS
jgi:hypothetical protein